MNKTTIYRRWPTKADLVAAAIRASAGHHEALPDTGSTRRDLVEMLRRAIAFAGTPEGRAVTRLISVESGDPDVDQLGRSLRAGLLRQRSVIIERGKLRGELPAETDPGLLVDAIFMPVTTRILRHGEDVDAATAEAFVDLALAGARNGAARAQVRD